MSIKQYPGGIITKNPTAPTTSAAQGIWTLDQAQNYTKQGIWPRSPGAPTIGTATATGSTTATVAFTAPTDLGTGSITYTATSSPGGLTGTGTSPITVSGLTASTSYTFSVTGATPGGTGPASAASNSITTSAVAGQQQYTTAGTYSWVAPAGVTSVSVLAIGGGGGGDKTDPADGGSGGGGGGLGYKNNYSVTAGSSYTVVVGAGAVGSSTYGGSYTGLNGNDSYFVSTAVVNGGKGFSPTNGRTGGSYTGDGGGNGGTGGTASLYAGGGGGTGGYAGTGGNGGAGTAQNTGGSGTGGGSGGGGAGGITPMEAVMLVLVEVRAFLVKVQTVLVELAALLDKVVLVVRAV